MNLFLEALCKVSYDWHFVFVFLHVGKVSNNGEVFDMLPDFIQSLRSHTCSLHTCLVNRQEAFKLGAVIGEILHYLVFTSR